MIHHRIDWHVAFVYGGHAGFLCLCVGACSCWVSSVLAAHCDYLALVRVLKMWRG